MIVTTSFSVGSGIGPLILAPNLKAVSAKLKENGWKVEQYGNNFIEAGIENDDCQRAVASVVLNRAIIAQAPLEDIIYAPNQFTPANKIPYTTPSQRCIDNVEYVLNNGTTIPRYVTFFRADHYFDWGNRYKQYTQYDNTYFSYDVELYERYQSGELS